MKTLSLKAGVLWLILIGIMTLTTTSTAYAQTTREALNAQLQSLLAQIAVLQQQLATLHPSECHSFISDLTLGQTGTEVTALQQYLIGRGYSIPAGATGYFGNQTRQAVAAFQAKNGVNPASGNFGPITRGKIQSLCATSATPTPTTPTPTPTPTTTPSVTLRGEADFDRFEMKDGDDTDIEEDKTDAKVAEVSFRVQDGDANINRIDVGFTADTGNNEKDPWDTFKTVSIWQNNKRIATVDASKESNWREDSSVNDQYTVRFSGISQIVKEDTNVTFIVTVSTQRSIKGTADGEIWSVFIPDNGIRALDADRAAIYTGDTADSVTLNLDRAGATDEIIVRRSDKDPDASTLELSDSTQSGYVKVFTFDIDTDDSTSDIEIRKLPIDIELSSSDLTTLVREARLKVGSKTYTKEVLTNGTPGTITFSFDSSEFTIDAGDRISVDLELNFKTLSASNEGVTLSAAVDASDITANGRDDLAGGQLAGAANSETHTLNSKGTKVPTSPTITSSVTSVSGATNDYATFSIKVELSPFGQDVYIPVGTDGVNYRLTDANGNVLFDTGTAVVSSSARESDGYFFIPEGSTETLTLKVTYQPGVANTTARLELLGINYNDTKSAPDQTWVARPESKYRTQTEVIVD